eukprot:TRINITY_DN50951_c0_g1_i1.p1 TRINITY_DN50951_c0_g1~~TRINITY_DN50951_c0_g1_i1.p1  ORF type:complete len:220 (+),score=32.49 TRINITY_DN50951_c0_g1_i1:25-660(+)
MCWLFVLPALMLSVVASAFAKDVWTVDEGCNMSFEPSVHMSNVIDVMCQWFLVLITLALASGRRRHEKDIDGEIGVYAVPSDDAMIEPRTTIMTLLLAYMLRLAATTIMSVDLLMRGAGNQPISIAEMALLYRLWLCRAPVVLAALFATRGFPSTLRRSINILQVRLCGDVRRRRRDKERTLTSSFIVGRSFVLTGPEVFTRAVSDDEPMN